MERPLRPLSSQLRLGIGITAAINLVVGLAFLFGPELGVTLWPTPIPAIIMRFIGAIVLGNCVGLVVVARQGTWEGARALFAVGFVYGIVVLPSLLYHLLIRDAPQVLWVYAIADATFLAVIAYVWWRYETASG
jgi:hypothetical protein